MKYESCVLKQLVDTYGVIGNPRYLSEIIKEFIVRGKELYPQLFTYQSDWLAHIVEFGLTPEYTVSYTGQHIYAPNTKEKPVKSAILKGCTGYRDIDTGEILETFEEGRNLELVSVKMPVLTTTGKNLFSGIHTQTTDLYGRYYVGNDTYTLSLSDKDTTIDLTGIGFGNSIPNSVNWLMNNGEVYGTSRTFTNSHIVYYPNSEETLNKLKQRFNIQIEKGSVATPYEPYKSNILSTPSDLELCGIGDVKDELDLLTGEVVQRISEIVLDGSEKSELWSASSSDFLRLYVRYNGVKGANCYSDKFINYQLQSGIDSNFESVACVDGGFTFVIAKNKLTTQDANGFDKWLSQNPTTIQYQLATESIKTVDLTIHDKDHQKVGRLTTFEGGTHFTTSSQDGSLLPTITVDVVTDLEETLMVCSLEGNTM